VRVGIGLNSGECCGGNLGSLRRFDYSAIGDEVNVASRLEGACKIFEVDVIGSETTRAEAPDFVWLEIDSVLLKNKTRPGGLYALAGDPTLAASDKFADLSRLHTSMLAAYRTGTSPMRSRWRRRRPARRSRFAAYILTTCAVSPNWPRVRRTRIGVL
jgi:adenylate cyclase